jgi:L-amino acid N-acyltransferase YncA
MLRIAQAADAASLAAIYNHFVLHTVVTFEEAAVAVQEMAERISQTTSAGLPWLVIERDAGILGYAHASKWKGRCAYRFAVETTVYLQPGMEGRGLGSILYAELLRRLTASGYHCAIGGIALPNAASVRLHEKLGFEKVAHFKEVGFKQARWIDVGYWQKQLT